jgi:hypothetical protein
MDIRLKCPFTALVVGPTNSGKTELTKRLLAQRSIVMKDAPEQVVWCYGVWQPGYEELKGDVTFVQGIPSPSMLRKGNFLLVVDDLMHETQHSETLAKIFTKYSHHGNISCLYILQNLFPRGAQARNISINAQYLFLMKNIRDRAQIAYLARQIYPGNGRFLTTSFEDATHKSYSYLVLDFHPETHDDIRVRTSVFPDETVMAYKVPG